MTTGLTPQACSLIEMAYRVGAPRFHELSPAQARHSFRKLQFAFRPEAPAVGATTEVPMRRPDGSVLLARMYRPRDAAPHGALPVLIFFHGGGWCVGDVESYDVFCRELCNLSECAVLSVDYRLAPEHPFPAAIHDAMLALDWTLENAELLDVDPARLAMGGDSAGGNLSIVTALGARDRGVSAIRHLTLIYPSTQITSHRPSRREFAEGYFLDRKTLEWFYERYLSGIDHSDWRASPMCAHSLAGLPSMFLATAGCDPLTDDCIAFAERVCREGGEVERWHADGVVHGFITLGRLFPEAADGIRRAALALRRAIAS